MNIKNIAILLFSILLLNGIYAATTNYDTINLVADTYNYSPVPVTPGDEFELWIQLTNNSNTTADNVTYILETKYPFMISDFNNEEQITIKLAPYQTTIIKYKLTTDIRAVTGSYELEFKFKHGSSTIYNVKKYTIDVSTDASVLDLIEANTSAVSIGSEGTVELTLKNLSSQNIKDVFVTLDNATGDYVTVLDLKTKYFDKVNTLEKIKANYRINISKTVTQNSYTLPITIKYTDTTGEHTLTRNLGIKINDDPKIIFNLVSIGQAKNNKIYSNNKEKIDFEIYNVGNVDAEGVYIEMTSSITDNSPKYFIGSIEKDNYDSVTLEFTTKDIKPGSYPVQITIKYKDSGLIEKEIVKGINIEVVKNPTEKSAITTIINAIVGIVIGIIALALFILIFRWAYNKILIPAFGGFFTKIFKKRK